MSKAILLVRVSTEAQNFDEQERELYNLALSDGFAESDIIPICEKESGIKLKEEERNGLNQMKKLIADGGVSTVYAWEVSRIARKKKVLFSVVDYLVENKVQLIVKEPYLRLLNPDKTINDGAETILTLYAQIAESEMRNKKARWHRTHIANSRSGKWNGGPGVRFGYTLDENNYYIIDEAEAEIVRKAFEIYTTTNQGITKVVRELNKLGYDVKYNRIAKILVCEHYTGKLLPAEYWYTDESGKCKKVKGLDLKYPAIITEETYEEAKRRRATNNSVAYKRESYYFGRGLMKCPSCGSQMVADKGNGWYCCNDFMHRANRGGTCKDRTSVGINLLDTILWDATVSEYINANRISKEDKIETAKAKIIECQKIIDTISSRLAKTESKAKRYAFLFGEGDIEEDEYNQRKLQIAKERSEIEQDRFTAEEKIRQNMRLIESNDEPNMIDQINSLSEEAFGISELKEMCEIVHTYINKVEVTQDDKRYKYITVYAYSGAVYKYRARYNGHRQIYWREADKIVMQSLSPWVEFVPNITIVRKVGHLKKRNLMEKEFTIIKNDEMTYNVQNEI